MRLIDADAIYNKAVENSQNGEIEDWEADSIIDYLDGAPTINDAEIVVRCKDCKYGELYSRNDGRTGVYCKCHISTFTYANDHTFTPVRNEDDFCSYGKRKEESLCES